MPRISEDLDFDIENDDFNIEKFKNDLSNYLTRKIGFNDFTLKSNGRTVLIKFPILRQIGFSDLNDSEMLYLKIDFAQSKGGNTENKVYLRDGFSFIARCYDLNTLFSNKVDAFLNRICKKETFKQKTTKVEMHLTFTGCLMKGEKMELIPN